MDTKIFYGIPGWFDSNEGALLERLASQSKTIVEIGTYYGRSTYALACGAKAGGGHVTTIDPYTPQTIGEMVVTPDIPAEVVKMLNKHGLTNVVFTIKTDATKFAKTWDKPIDLLFIDASHEYKDVKADFTAWSKHVTGYIAFHDYSDNWPGVQRLVSEIIGAKKWVLVEQADATVVLRKA